MIEVNISLLSAVGKVLADILLQRLQFVLTDVYPASQHGYRSDRGTIDGIFTVRQLMEKTRKQRIGCNLYIAFIDFTKAFDTVNRQLLFSLLEKNRLSPKTHRYVEVFVLYCESSTEHRWRVIKVIRLQRRCQTRL